MTPESDTLLQGRYRVVAPIARGAQGSTSRAIDEKTGAVVAIKELDFAGIGNWDAVLLFEREVAVLGGLDHPEIPRVFESFRVEGEHSLRLFLVQEFVEGDDLGVRLGRGELFDERRLRNIASRVLEILVYLHGHSPPVLHRDIKPSNLIERPNGFISLVDFGAAQGATREASVIGTTGYMPAEQLMGRARPASDLFALGATLVHLATRKHPGDLGEGLGLEWRRFANLSTPFGDWLDQMVAPMPEDRFPSALAATRALEDLEPRRREVVRRPDEDLELLADPRAVEVAGRYKILRSGNRLFVECRNAAIPRGTANAVMLAGITLGWAGVYFAQSFMFLPIFVLGLIPLLIASQGSRMKEIHGSERGLDVVWAGEEVVERIKPGDIAGPEVVEGRTRRLVIWRRDGSSVVLDDVGLTSRSDIETLHAAILAWMVAVRERE